MRVTSSWRRPASPGCTGFPEQLSALIAMPWSASRARNSRRAVALSSRWSSFEVRRRRPVAAAEFEHVHLEAGGNREHGLEIEVRQAVGDHSDFHGDVSGLSRGGFGVAWENETVPYCEPAMREHDAAIHPDRLTCVRTVGGPVRIRERCAGVAARLRESAMNPLLNERIAQFESPFRRLDALSRTSRPIPSWRRSSCRWASRRTRRRRCWPKPSPRTPANGTAIRRRSARRSSGKPRSAISRAAIPERAAASIRTPASRRSRARARGCISRRRSRRVRRASPPSR